MTSQRAPPDVNGFGTSTSTPGRSRSSHVRMCLGFPLRTTSTTTEFVTNPRYRSAFQSEATNPSLTRRVMSGSSENATTSAGRPESTARLWSPDAPYDSLNVTFAPAAVFSNAAKIFSYACCGVEYATSPSLTGPCVVAPPDTLPQAAAATRPSALNSSARTYERRVGLTNGCTGSPS